MILSLFPLFVLPLLCLAGKSASSGRTKKIQLDCDVRPFNDLHLLNYFLKQQLKQSPIPSDDLSRRFYEFRDTVNLNQLEEECEKKSRAKFALIKRNNGKKFEFDSGSVNKNVQKNRKKISQRMSLELVNALLLGKLLGLNLGMLSSFLFSSAFKPGRTTPIPGGGGNAGGGGGMAPAAKIFDFYLLLAEASTNPACFLSFKVEQKAAAVEEASEVQSGENLLIESLLTAFSFLFR